MRVASFVLAAVGAWIVAAGPVNAADPLDPSLVSRVAIVTIDAKGIPEAMVPQLGNAIAAGLGISGFTIVGFREVTKTLSDAGAPAECSDAACFRTTSELLSAPFLLYSRIRRKGDDFRIELRIVDATLEGVSTSTVETCELCGFVRLQERLTKVSMTLRTKITTARRAAPPPKKPTLPDPVLVASPVEVDRPPKARRPVAQRWWLWTLVGVVAVGGGVATAVILATRSVEIPETSLGVIDGR